AFVVDPYDATEGTFGWVDSEVEKLDERSAGRKPRRPKPPSSPRNRSRRVAPLVALGIIATIAGLFIGVLVSDSGSRRTRPTKQTSNSTTHGKSKATQSAPDGEPGSPKKKQEH